MAKIKFKFPTGREITRKHREIIALILLAEEKLSTTVPGLHKLPNEPTTFRKQLWDWLFEIQKKMVFLDKGEAEILLCKKTAEDFYFQEKVEAFLAAIHEHQCAWSTRIESLKDSGYILYLKLNKTKNQTI